jgi:hypothetical protein
MNGSWNDLGTVNRRYDNLLQQAQVRQRDHGRLNQEQVEAQPAQSNPEPQRSRVSLVMLKIVQAVTPS